jgi:hypothetical protein
VAVTVEKIVNAVGWVGLVQDFVIQPAASVYFNPFVVPSPIVSGIVDETRNAIADIILFAARATIQRS